MLISLNVLILKKNENGKVTVVHCTYDPITKNGTGFTGRKVKGTIHWVPVHHCKKVTARYMKT